MEPNSNDNQVQVPANSESFDQTNLPESGDKQLEPEQTPIIVPERTPQPSEPPTTPVVSKSVAATSLPVDSTPILPVSQPANSTRSSSPSVAKDVDVIEKEWVNQAETIVKKDAADPHQEEDDVTDLKNDYLQKRYGKTIKKEVDGQ